MLPEPFFEDEELYEPILLQFEYLCKRYNYPVRVERNVVEQEGIQWLNIYVKNRCILATCDREDEVAVEKIGMLINGLWLSFERDTPMEISLAEADFWKWYRENKED